MPRRERFDRLHVPLTLRLKRIGPGVEEVQGMAAVGDLIADTLTVDGPEEHLFDTSTGDGRTGAGESGPVV